MEYSKVIQGHMYILIIIIVGVLTMILISMI